MRGNVGGQATGDIQDLSPIQQFIGKAALAVIMVLLKMNKKPSAKGIRSQVLGHHPFLHVPWIDAGREPLNGRMVLANEKLTPHHQPFIGWVDAVIVSGVSQCQMGSWCLRKMSGPTEKGVRQSLCGFLQFSCLVQDTVDAANAHLGPFEPNKGLPGRIQSRFGFRIGWGPLSQLQDVFQQGL